MGRRLLKKWLSYPLLAKTEIERRLDRVEEFSQNLIGRSEIRKKLKYFTDLARLNSKIAGIPKAVIERSKEILLNLEKKELNRLVKERITGRIQKAPPQNAGLFPEDMELKVWDEIRDKLKEIDIASITPLEALNILQFLKSKSDKFQ